jgi:uncharacterized membrane protein
MGLPFEGFVVPPLPYTVVLALGTIAVVATLYAIEVPVTERLVLAFAPWMVSGAALHVLYQIGERFQARLYPPVLEPLFSAPAVYLTTFVTMGAAWILAATTERTIGSVAEESGHGARYLGGLGAGVMVVVVGLVLRQGLDPAIDPEPLLPTAGVVVALVLTFVLYVIIGAWRTYVVAEARYAGALVLFAHVLDGVTTTIGVDVLGSGERSALPARIMDFAAGLPTAEFIGTGWLFLVVKIAVASAVVVLFADYVREEPSQGNLLFALVAAVGLGPATNNYLLFVLGLA